MKRIFTLILVAAMAIGTASAWGRLGHATVAKIAENHLTKGAKKHITEYTYAWAQQNYILMLINKNGLSSCLQKGTSTCCLDYLLPFLCP